LWGCLALNVIWVTQLLKYLKLEELAIIMVLGNVKDDKSFSTIKFMKSKFCNCLIICPSGQNVCAKILQAKCVPLLNCNLGVGEGEWRLIGQGL
jgi:hypothetical protein